MCVKTRTLLGARPRRRCADRRRAPARVLGDGESRRLRTARLGAGRLRARTAGRPAVRSDPARVPPRARTRSPRCRACPCESAFEPDPTMRYAARLLYAQWRDVGLGSPARDRAPRRAIVPRACSPPTRRRRRFRRSLPCGDGIGQRAQLVRALGATQQHARSRQARRRAVSLRRESCRLRGWSTRGSSHRGCAAGAKTCLGTSTTRRVRSRASSRRP